MNPLFSLQYPLTIYSQHELCRKIKASASRRFLVSPFFFFIESSFSFFPTLLIITIQALSTHWTVHMDVFLVDRLSGLAL